MKLGDNTRLAVGDMVKGEYHGVPFAGMVTDIEPDWTEGSYRKSNGGYHVTVSLHTPITVGKDPEERSSLWLGSVLSNPHFTIERG